MIVSKTELMEIVARGGAREAFTFCPDSGGEEKFDVTAMREWAHNEANQHHAPVVLISLDQIVGHVQANRDFEAQRVKDLSEWSWRQDPGIFILMKNGSHLMIDGHHRAIRRFQEGEKDMVFFMIREEFAIHPSTNWAHTAKFGVDWGEKHIVGGQLVKRN